MQERDLKFLARFAIDPEADSGFDGYDDLDSGLDFNIDQDADTFSMDELDDDFLADY